MTSKNTAGQTNAVVSRKARIVLCAVALLIPVLFFAVQASRNAGASGSPRPLEAQATFTVTNASDSGAGSLRQVMAEANSAAGADTITFAATFFNQARVINLASALPAISDSLTITGPGANLLTVRRDTGGDYRLFRINSGVTATISGITISNGNAGGGSGGGIFNSGTLTVTSCNITGNTALNGGGILNDGTLSVGICHISGNTATFGGGIFSALGSQPVSISQSTISGNTATGNDTGAGIDSRGATTIINSTISSNAATGSTGNNGGGLRLSSSNAFVLENTTITNNAAAGTDSASGLRIVSLGAVTLRNCLIAANVNNVVIPDISAASGTTVTSGGYNLIGNRGAVTFNGTNDQSGTVSPINPQLGPLQSNGGPTPTHTLGLTSPALDKGSRFGAISDQRGTTRPFDVAGITNPGDGSDIGAVEMQAIIVSNANDIGAGSLRQAITDANAEAGLSEILFDTTFFNAPRIINLLTALPDISSNLTINGPGANLLTISGANDRSVFGIKAGFTVSLRGMTITGGRGGINNDGTLAVTDLIISGNEGTGMANSGTLTVANSTISGNTSGGIVNVNFADLTSGSNILNVINSTISGNRGRPGGGIRSVFGRVNITNSTITNNSAEGAFGAGGLYTDTSGVSVRNSIIAANGNDAAIPDVRTDGPGSGGFGSTGYNLIGNRGDITSFGPGDQSGTAAAPLNPLLGPLQDNGGPTPTHALLAGSPALDQGNSAGISLDQRGQARAFDVPGIAAASGGDSSDIGAVEMQAVMVANTNDTGAGSLRNAIQSSPAGSDILFDPTVFNTPRTITTATGEIAISRNMTITGPARNLLTITGGDQNRIFSIASNASVRLSGMTITNGASPSGQRGGAILNSGTLSVTNCIIARSVATGSGGGGIFSSGQLAIHNSLIFGNSANDVGGVWAEGNGLTMTSCTVSGNTAVFATAGVYIANSTIGARLTSCTVSGNTAASFTGGVRNLNSPMTLTSCTIASNRSNSGGGGASFSGPAFLRNTIVANNSGQQMATGTTGIVVTSQGFNLAGDGGGGFLTQPTDLINTDPLLSGLGENGGPTPTHTLLVGSPAIDKGNSFGESRDQRGVRRPLDDANLPNATGGDGADIGAFERVLPTVVSASSYKRDPLAQESIVAAFGETLTTNIAEASALPLPTTLDNTSVFVLDAQNSERPAALFYVSPGQINFQIPTGTAIGAATVFVRRSGNTVSSTTVNIAAVEPSLFTANSSGSGAPAAYLVRVKPDNSQTIEPVATVQGGAIVPAPISLGPQGDQLILVLFGTGIRKRSALGAVTLRIDTETLGVVFADPAPGFIGLDQINSNALLRTLAGKGTVNVTLTVDGRQTNTVLLNFQ